MTNLEEGKTYQGDEVEDILGQLRSGDEIESWDCDGMGMRGTVVKSESRVKVRTASLAGIWTLVNICELTITKLVPREPEWAGAKAVIDSDGDVWSIDGGKYRGPRLTFDRWPEEIENIYGPCQVLIDRDGKIPVETLMAVNEVSERDVHDAIYQDLGPEYRYRRELVIDTLRGTE